MLCRVWYDACLICYFSHDTWHKGKQTVYLLVCNWAVLHVFFTVTTCEIATLIWRGILMQEDREGSLENLLLCSEAWSCAAATVDFLVLIDVAHRTRKICKVRFMCSAHHGESQTMYKYELGECFCMCVCVCVCVTCCLNSTYSTRGGCVHAFSVFANSLHSRSLNYMANVFWLYPSNLSIIYFLNTH